MIFLIFIFRREFTRIQWASLAVLFLAVMSLSSQSGSSHPRSDLHDHQLVDHVTSTNLSKAVSRIKRYAKSVHAKNKQVADLCQSVKTVSILNHMNETSLTEDTLHGGSALPFNIGYLFILLQCLFSSLANIYNEKIFKEETKGCIFVKNCKLYMFGIFFSVLLILIPNSYREHVFTCGVFNGHNAFSVTLIFVTALYGLNVALILIFRDNMFHVFSLQLITITVILISVAFLKFRPQMDFFFSAPIVLLTIYIYNAAKIKPAGMQGSAVCSTDQIRYTQIDKVCLVQFLYYFCFRIAKVNHLC